MRVGISGDVLLDQSHPNIESSNTVCVVTCFHDTHEFVIHDQGGGFQPVHVLTQGEFGDRFPLQCEDGGGSNGERPWFRGIFLRLILIVGRVVVFGVGTCWFFVRLGDIFFGIVRCWFRGFLRFVNGSVGFFGRPCGELIVLHGVALRAQEHK